MAPYHRKLNTSNLPTVANLGGTSYSPQDTVKTTPIHTAHCTLHTVHTQPAWGRVWGFQRLAPTKWLLAHLSVKFPPGDVDIE